VRKLAKFLTQLQKYRDDPVLEEWHKYAVDVQGGPDASSSSSDDEDDDELSSVAKVTLPETCVCSHCR
jgi:hypothetical protein